MSTTSDKYLIKKSIYSFTDSSVVACRSQNTIFLESVVSYDGEN